MSFTFSFSGDDIDIETATEADTSASEPRLFTPPLHAAETGTLARTSLTPATHATNTAFPIPGQVLLPAQSHALSELVAKLPSSISYGELKVGLDADSLGRGGGGGGGEGGRREVGLLRRELWDVRVQLMAEGDVGGEGEVGLGRDDVKTGVYEGGFKSWESSVDLVRVVKGRGVPGRVLEMGCGTALPTISILQHYLENAPPTPQAQGISLTLADYNPTVLHLVTLPNILLTWARHHALTSTGDPWLPDGELEITPELIAAFQASLQQRKIELNFLSGAWSPEFVEKFTSISSEAYPYTYPDVVIGSRDGASTKPSLLILAAETIYSPFALQSFTTTLLDILESEAKTRNKNRNQTELHSNSEAGDEAGQQESESALALVGAKKVYFGVGGSMEDFYDGVRVRGAVVKVVREETDGVRRAVAEVRLR